ncbi:gamma carbonic anhydrase family protein [Thiohalobacter sp.]|uniref:gamma carbonic anhydrase family protein n=1 Tax=Thiohalobacter sp. TaxID=2025948 RepID=UPI00260367DD|nr:gamma carbonic anhydrase family protein [Thiohalobacter sp.]
MSIRDFEGHSPRIAASAWIDPMALVIGDVEIGADSSLWPGVVARGDIHYIRIGARTNIQDGSILHVTHDSEYAPGGHPLVVGDDVTVGHQVTLHACTIEDKCLIGMGSIILDGAIVRSGAMVGAGSLVSPGKELEGGYLWLGQPARRARPLTEQEKAYLEYSAAHYVRLARRHAGN